MAEPPSIRCRECGFDFELDDIYLLFSSGWGICEPCHQRIVEETPRPMDKGLRRDTQATLNGMIGWI